MARKTVPEWLNDRGNPVLFAHRGCSLKAPENTMSAFELAKEYGIPGIELDVQMCKSGELIVFHDFNFSRIGGRDEKTTDLTWAEIRTLDAGKALEGVYVEEKIPLLSEVFEHFGSAFIFDIEIKHRDRTPHAIEEKVVQLIRQFDLSGRCVVSSFNPFSIKEIHAIAPSIPTAIIYAKDAEVPAALRRGGGRFLASPVILKPHMDQVNKWTMFHRNKIGGYPVIPWTVDTREEAAALLSLGVSGIVSNCPEELGI